MTAGADADMPTPLRAPAAIERLAARLARSPRRARRRAAARRAGRAGTRGRRWLLAVLVAAPACGGAAHDVATLTRGVESVVRSVAEGHLPSCCDARLAVRVDVHGVDGRAVVARLAREGLAVRALADGETPRSDVCALRVLTWTSPTRDVPPGAVPLSAWVDRAGAGPVTREDVAVLVEDGRTEVRRLHLLSYL